MTLPLGSQFSFEELDDPFNAPFLHDDDDSDSDFISFGIGSDLRRKTPERLPAPKVLSPFDRKRSAQSPLPETVNMRRRKRLPGPAVWRDGAQIGYTTWISSQKGLFLHTPFSFYF
ncbi:hypothetical protein CLF_109430 [Clonorchis sinensis]|uniref:Uncharacterized protein n=1 Tax=Clonorchis sinensis TaxID=79923 RepID=G7YSL5_CLOSI|nr:hypothetical protein CLF_109430 [Clonorchis sinensis]